MTVAQTTTGLDATAERQRAQMAAQGYYAENFPRGAAGSASALATGTVIYTSVGLVAGDTVTNFCVACNAAINTPTGIGVRFGLYTKALVLVASTGDVSASFSAVGAKTLAATAPYSVPVTDSYYVAVLAVATTGPALMRSTTGTNGSGPFSGGTTNMFGAQAAQTDLPTTPVMITNSGVIGVWAGIS